jgi:hypothetical protein
VVRRNPLGSSDLEVFPLALGGGVFGWKADEPASHGVLDAYVEAGGNFVDTADSYSAWVEGNARSPTTLASQAFRLRTSPRPSMLPWPGWVLTTSTCTARTEMWPTLRSPKRSRLRRNWLIRARFGRSARPTTRLIGLPSGCG